MLHITLYKNSVLASLVSIVGSLSVLAGIALALGGAIFGGIFMALLGFGCAALASIISSRVQFRKWIKEMEKNGVIAQAKGNAVLAIKIFDANPTKQTLAYIRKLNPTAAGYIDQHLAAEKNAA